MSVNCQHSKLTEEDLAKLEQTFKECRHPDGLTISFVAAEIGVPSDEIQKWFADRLQKWRKDEGFMSIAERSKIFTQNIREEAK